jgi:hypothetical protein
MVGIRGWRIGGIGEVCVALDSREAPEIIVKGVIFLDDDDDVVDGSVS